MNRTISTFFATTAAGTEAALATELGALDGVKDVKAEVGGVRFEGTLEAGYRACLWSRVASRILLPLASFEVPDADALYEGVGELAWTDHISPRRTLAVSVAGHSSSPGLINTRFVAQRTKDAIVDRVREATGDRPSVDLKSPDVRINVYLDKQQAIVSLDLSGDGLHRRGLSRDGASAPLKENLAAALLLMADWPTMAAEGAPLVDPMCGSGTFLIEGAWMAMDVAPGLMRERHGFERWAGHDPALWRTLHDEARQRRRQAAVGKATIQGFDRSRTAIQAALGNIRSAGLNGVVTVARQDFDELDAPESYRAETPYGLLVVNPPYGERLGQSDDLGPLYTRLGDTFKRRFPGWRACILTGNKALARRVGLRPDLKHPVYNGPIRCQWLIYPISAEAPVNDEGPGWRKPSPQAEMFVNRLNKNLKRLGRWARKDDIHCYRLYDADIPEYNVTVDLYDGAVQVTEIDPPRSVSRTDAERRRRDVALVVPEVLGVEETAVVHKIRRKGVGGDQYPRRGDLGVLREVREGGLRFLINLTDYLDTGLFLDGRLHREWVRQEAAGQDFLNLFAYTCTASVYAAAGGAATTTSVDLSGSYLTWGRRNLTLNGFHDQDQHRTVREDVMAWLKREEGRYGVIFVAPPTYSRSRRTESDFDVQRDHVGLLRLCSKLLTPEGQILFTNPLQSFTMDHDRLDHLEIEELTAALTPEDFRRSRNPIHTTWRLRLRNP